MNQFLQKWLPAMTPLAVIAGVLANQMLEPAAFLVPWIFACMSFANSITIHPREIKQVFRFPRSFFLTFVALQLILPFCAYIAGILLFPDDVWTQTGLLLAFSIPTGIVSLMWISIYGGNRTLALCLILANTLLAPICIPLTLAVFLGTELSLDTFGIFMGVFWMVVAPSLAALTINAAKPAWASVINVVGAPFTKLGLLVVIMLNSSVAAPYFLALDIKLATIIATVLALAIIGYLTGLWLGKATGSPKEDQISMMLLSGMRNIGVGAAIAIVYFPPAATLPVIAGTLFQQVLAALFGKWQSLSPKHSTNPYNAAKNRDA